jgi:predicted pyridoxine 5'-phosphate oxidase superfamily flavin-nucleotide-binding protein
MKLDMLLTWGKTMAYGFLDIASTPSVKAAQEVNGSRSYFAEFKGKRQFDKFGAAETAFVHERDSFYIATVSETGWPYVQHRGGPRGFLRVLDEKTLAFADFRGNRQYITLGNASANDRVSLFLMDYPGRRRLKIYARIEVKELASNPALTEQVVPAGYRGKPERVFLLHLEAFDWNCSQHITPRFTEGDIDAALRPVRARIAQVEAENKILREKLAGTEKYKAGE